MESNIMLSKEKALKMLESLVEEIDHDIYKEIFFHDEGFDLQSDLLKIVDKYVAVDYDDS